jgi:hypothetical protein
MSTYTPSAYRARQSARTPRQWLARALTKAVVVTLFPAAYLISHVGMEHLLRMGS